MRSQQILTLSGTVAAAAFLVGCPHPNTYGTPRTTPSGSVAHTIAIEAYQFRGDVVTGTDASGKPIRETRTFTLPSAPTYQLRVGIIDMLDIGVRVANMSSIGGDVKINPVKSEKFDLAVDPGLQYFSVSASSTSSSGSSSASVGVLYFHLPVLLGINVTETFAIVLTPGIVYARSSTTAATDDRSAITTAGGTLGRFGIGFDFRISDGFAIHPEVTAMRNFNADVGNPTLVLLGFGFNFGKLPDRPGDAAPPPYSPPPPGYGPPPGPAPAGPPGPPPAGPAR